MVVKLWLLCCSCYTIAATSLQLLQQHCSTYDVQAQAWQKSSKQLVQDVADYYGMEAKEVVYKVTGYQQKHPEQVPHIYTWICGDGYWQKVRHFTNLLSTVMNPWAAAGLADACMLAHRNRV